MLLLQKNLPLPARMNRGRAILPLFLPFAGCPGKCVFCAQDKQSGGGKAEENITAMHNQLKERARRDDQGLELAFYGGTFTALPSQLQTKCLNLYREFATCGLLTHGRCSTRPDSLGTLGGHPLRPLPKALAGLPVNSHGNSWADPLAALEELLPLGFNCIELGIQSFSTTALLAAGRGYDETTAHFACEKVKSRGFSLGIQLLPGMPGVSPEVFLADVALALTHKPDLLRFYPCLVPEGTELAHWWAKGHYTPWDLPTTVQTLGKALALAWEAKVPVARLALAPEEGFDTGILAGPHHPALGSMVQAEALEILADKAEAALSLEAAAFLGQILPFPYNKPGRLEKTLFLPPSFQGFIWGHGGAKKATWALRGFLPANICLQNTQGNGRVVWQITE